MVLYLAKGEDFASDWEIRREGIWNSYISLGVMVSTGQRWPLVWQVLLIATKLFLSTHAMYNNNFLHRLKITLLSAWVPLSLFVPSLVFSFCRSFPFSVSASFFPSPYWPSQTCLPGSLYFRLWGYNWNKSKIMGLVWLEESTVTPACGFLRPDQREVRWGEEFVWI